MCIVYFLYLAVYIAILLVYTVLVMKFTKRLKIGGKIETRDLNIARSFKIRIVCYVNSAET